MEKYGLKDDDSREKKRMESLKWKLQLYISTI